MYGKHVSRREMLSRCANGSNRRRTRFVIEQDTTAPIDLHVDESRQQYLPREIDGDGIADAHIGRRNQGFDSPARARV